MLGHLDLSIKVVSLSCGGFPFLDTPLILRVGNDLVSAINSPWPLFLQQDTHGFRNSLLRDFPEREYRRHPPHRLSLGFASSSDSRKPPSRACAPLPVGSSHHCRVCFLIFPFCPRLHYHLCYQQPHQSNIPNHQFHMSANRRLSDHTETSFRASVEHSYAGTSQDHTPAHDRSVQHIHGIRNRGCTRDQGR